MNDIHIDANGYLRDSATNQYIHRLVVENILGRKLNKDEIVHHIDSDKTNNHPSNLLVCKQDYHLLIHARTRCVEAGFDPDLYLRCSGCKTYHLKEEFSTTNSHWSGFHPTCRSYTNQYRKDTGINTGKFDWKARLNQQYRRIAKQYTKRNISWLK